MADRDRADTALGLCRFAGVVDDEGIDHRHVANQRFRPAGSRQRDGLAGQPFQRSVSPHMDDGINALAPQPEIKCNVGVARRAREIVILGIAIADIAAFRLDGDSHLAAPDRGETKFAAATGRIVFRRAPGTREIVLQPARKPGQLRAIIGNAPGQCFP